MVNTAAPHCTRLPDHTRVRLWSATALKSIVTTLQGLSAVYSLIGGLVGVPGLDFITIMGLDMVFFPLAILGLLRLCAATWLADDFEYVPSDAYRHLHRAMPRCDASDCDPFLIVGPDEGSRFKSPGSSWPSMVFRVFYLSVVGSVWSISLVYVMPGVHSGLVFYATTTSFLVGLFYLVFTTVSVVLYAYYFLRGQTTTTLLPCLSSLWYKVYTLALFAFMLAVVIIACVETTKGPDGHYRSDWDWGSVVKLDCESRNKWWFVAPELTFSGLMSTKKVNVQRYSSVEATRLSGNISLAEETYHLYNFTGLCMGQMTNISTL